MVKVKFLTRRRVQSSLAKYFLASLIEDVLKDLRVEDTPEARKVLIDAFREILDAAEAEEKS